MHAVSRFTLQPLKYTFYKAVRLELFRYRMLFCVSSDWDGIMERDNHQEGDAEGVKICDPPSESNLPGKLFNLSLHSKFYLIYLKFYLYFYNCILFSP